MPAITPTTLEEVLKEAFLEQKLLSATLSNPLLSKERSSIKIRPLMIHSTLHYQWTEQKNTQSFHKNLLPDESKTLLQQTIFQYKQTILKLKDADYQILVNKKGKCTILKKLSSKKEPLATTHNRQKQYLLPDSSPIPVLHALGISNREGRVYPHKQDKFRQINRFVEMVDDLLGNFPTSEPLHIVDFGCGKAYLTFALYHYLKVIKQYDVYLQGIDLKKDVVQECQKLAQEFHYNGLSFQIADIASYQRSQPVDMVISLHACNTATDAALEKAVRWKAKAVLCVPCCQQELFKQISNVDLQPLLKHGILKERFAALATDAARAQLLETLGYKVQVMEFIDLEHTPKNLLIRALLRPEAAFNPNSWAAYQQFKEELQINPSLEKFLLDLFPLQ